MKTKKINVVDIEKIRSEIKSCEGRAAKLKAELEDLDVGEINFSSVYLGNLAYAILYPEHDGNFEAYSVLSNQPAYLDDFAREEAKEWDGYQPIYIAAMRPVKLIKSYRVKGGKFEN